MLYIVATPIGNLKDITLRALETLKECDYILCEDTRKSSVLLRHYSINKPLFSYHKFNERARLEKTLEDLHSDKKIALISDAGTPTISDPGMILIQSCIEKNIRVEAIPGVSAAITALSCSGIIADKFQFLGFLSRKNGELKKQLSSAIQYDGITVFYESPHRLTKSLEILSENFPKTEITVCRELTKKFEEVLKCTAEEQLLYWRSKTIKGEITVLISPSSTIPESQMNVEEALEEIKKLASEGLKIKAAVKIVAQQTDLNSSELYRKYHNHHNNDPTS